MKTKEGASYEQKTEELSQIVQNLKTGELTLNEIMASVKKARKLYEECRKQIEAAKLELIELETTYAK